MLGSRFERRQWLQLPSVLLFSAMIDAWMAVLSRVPVEGAVACWSASLLANVVIAAGILLQLRSSLILQPIDGAVLAASIVTGRAFPTIKIANDVGCVIAAAAVGLVFFGNLYGIGAGTLVSAFAVGLLIKRLKPVSCPRTALRTCPSGPACSKRSTKRRPASRCGRPFFLRGTPGSVSVPAHRGSFRLGRRNDNECGTGLVRDRAGEASRERTERPSEFGDLAEAYRALRTGFDADGRAAPFETIEAAVALHHLAGLFIELRRTVGGRPARTCRSRCTCRGR